MGIDIEAADLGILVAEKDESSKSLLLNMQGEI